MTECVLSPYSTDPKGYGRCKVKRFGKVIRLAHMLAWIDVHGRLPESGKYICHTCDNPSCWNSEHLYEGSPADNSRDCSERGRAWYQKKTACVHGHEYTAETVYVSPQGVRFCKICRRLADKRRSK